jgi:hypothetical protein
MNEILILLVLAADIFLAYLLERYLDKEIGEGKEKKEKGGEKNDIHI